MHKKDNLLKFWESLKNNQQAKDSDKPFKPQFQSLKMTPSSKLKIRSVSQCDLLSPRQNAVPSKAQLQDWKKENTDAKPAPRVREDLDDGIVSKAEITESEDMLPSLPRNEILSHTTKSRVRRGRKHPVRQKKQLMQVMIIVMFNSLHNCRPFKVPSVKVSASVDKLMPINPNQTPPAALNEFSCFTKSPTSSRFLDKSPISSPKPSITSSPSAFSTFMTNPLKLAKSQQQKPAKKEVPAVPQRKSIPCSPKLSERYKEKVESFTVPPVIHQSPFKVNLKSAAPSKEDFSSGRTTSVKADATPSTDFVERRASLKAVTSPYKSLQVTTPTKSEPANLQPVASSPRIASLSANVKAVPCSPAAKTAGTEADLKSPAFSVDNSASTPVVSMAVNANQATSEIGEKNIGMKMKEFLKNIEEKVERLGSSLAEEKQARIKLEKEVEEMKFIIAKLNL